MSSSMKEQGLEPVAMTGGKRTNIGHAGNDYDPHKDWDWWVGWGKDESCQFEGPWKSMAILAAKILRHPNTRKVAENLYQPDIKLTPEQEDF